MSYGCHSLRFSLVTYVSGFSESDLSPSPSACMTAHVSGSFYRDSRIFMRTLAMKSALPDQSLG